MTKVEIFAPAKINLTLHVTGQREDGYHLLDSLVAFASVGDDVKLAPSDVMQLQVDGPEAGGVPCDTRNLALRAATLFSDATASMSLTKKLPAASGIGGGSADAAAAWRGMVAKSCQTKTSYAGAFEMAFEDHFEHLAALGADVPMCISCAPLRAQGVGTDLTEVTLPPLHAVLVNPRRPVSTPTVFKALASKTNPSMPEKLPEFSDAADAIAWIATMRNDLETPAVAVEPLIATVLGVISDQPGCGLARMSGSGATCFGLFEQQEHAKDTARVLSQGHPDWWVMKTILGDQSAGAVPKVS